MGLTQIDAILVADHIGDRLLHLERLGGFLAGVIDRRWERAERRREHLAELHRRTTEADQRLGRLFDAIEAGMLDKDDALAKEYGWPKALRDQAAADAERTQLALVVQQSGVSAPKCSRRLPAGPEIACGSTMAATATATCALAQRVEVQATRFAASDRSRNSCERWLPVLT